MLLFSVGASKPSNFNGKHFTVAFSSSSMYHLWTTFMLAVLPPSQELGQSVTFFLLAGRSRCWLQSINYSLPPGNRLAGLQFRHSLIYDHLEIGVSNLYKSTFNCLDDGQWVMFSKCYGSNEGEFSVFLPPFVFPCPLQGVRDFGRVVKARKKMLGQQVLCRQIVVRIREMSGLCEIHLVRFGFVKDNKLS